MTTEVWTQKLSPWISVDEAMPPVSTALDQKTVWVWVEHPMFREPVKGWWFGHHWQIAGSPGQDWVITHWSPLFKSPQFYEERENEEVL